MLDLSRVQTKLSEMTRSGEELRGEYAAEIRGKQSEVNVLKSNIGQYFMLLTDKYT